MQRSGRLIKRSSKLRLFYTPKSHFSRKVRLVLDHFGLTCELVDIGNVADASASLFAGNPAMTIPVLEVDGQAIFDSDNIAMTLSVSFDKDDQIGVRTTNIELLNGRAVMNAVMLADVRIVLANRLGEAREARRSLEKQRQSITNGLQYLRERSDLFQPEQPRFHELHFISMWDHLRLYDLTGDDWPDLAAIADQLRADPMINRSAPPG